MRLADAAKAAAKAAADSVATQKFGSHMVMMQRLTIETQSRQVHVLKLKLFRTSALWIEGIYIIEFSIGRVSIFKVVDMLHQDLSDTLGL